MSPFNFLMLSAGQALARHVGLKSDLPKHCAVAG